MTTSEIQILDSSDQETDDFSDDDYYYDYNNEEEDALDGIHIRKDIDLQFDRNYVSHWKAPDAARELIQNWLVRMVIQASANSAQLIPFTTRQERWYHCLQPTPAS